MTYSTKINGMNATGLKDIISKNNIAFLIPKYGIEEDEYFGPVLSEAFGVERVKMYDVHMANLVSQIADTPMGKGYPNEKVMVIIEDTADKEIPDELEDYDPFRIADDIAARKEAKAEVKTERNLTRAERHNRDMQRIFDFYDKWVDDMANFLLDKGLSPEEVEQLRQNTGLGRNALDDKIHELGYHDEFVELRDAKTEGKDKCGAECDEDDCKVKNESSEYTKLNQDPIAIDYNVDGQPIFNFNDTEYNLDDFVRTHDNPWAYDDFPEHIHGYYANDYYNPVYVGLSDDGDTVDVYSRAKQITESFDVKKYKYYTNPEIKESDLVKQAYEHYDDGDIDWFTNLDDDSLAKLWSVCVFTEDNTWGAAFDDEVYGAIADRSNSREIFDKADEYLIKKPR